MSKPFEIIVAPYTVYWAPLGEAFPAVNATPAGNWAVIGMSGERNLNEDGVTVGHAQTIERYRGAGATGPLKVSRTEESLVVRFTLWDLTLEQYRLTLNSNAIATTAAGSGTAGHKAVNIYRGVDVALVALLVRGVSPYDDQMQAQYEIPVCFEASTPEVAFSKSQPAGLAFEFEALEDPDATTPAERFGKLRQQHQAPLP